MRIHLCSIGRIFEFASVLDRRIEHCRRTASRGVDWKGIGEDSRRRWRSSLFLWIGDGDGGVDRWIAIAIRECVRLKQVE